MAPSRTPAPCPTLPSMSGMHAHCSRAPGRKRRAHGCTPLPSRSRSQLRTAASFHLAGTVGMVVSYLAPRALTTSTPAGGRHSSRSTLARWPDNYAPGGCRCSMCAAHGSTTNSSPQSGFGKPTLNRRHWLRPAAVRSQRWCVSNRIFGGAPTAPIHHGRALIAGHDADRVGAVKGRYHAVGEGTKHPGFAMTCKSGGLKVTDECTPKSSTR